jgi:hypothetical protein
MGEQSLISVALDRRSLERERVTSGQARRGKRVCVVVVAWSLSSPTETWLFAGESREEGERGVVAAVMGGKQGASGP